MVMYYIKNWIGNKMEDINNLKTKYSCQKTKDTINKYEGEYKEFVAMCLEKEDFVKAMNNLLPFDNVLQAKLKIVDNTSPVKSVSLCIMRMEPESPIFSLGICIEIAGSEDNNAINSTIFISACRTLEELKEYVKSEPFSMQVKENFEKQIEESFSGLNKNS